MLTKLTLAGGVDAGIDSFVAHHHLARPFAAHLWHAADLLGRGYGVFAGHWHFANATH